MPDVRGWNRLGTRAQTGENEEDVYPWGPGRLGQGRL